MKACNKRSDCNMDDMVIYEQMNTTGNQMPDATKYYAKLVHK